ncbi:hypothetical protein BF14_014360 [Streptomyces griseus]|nr:hypothetical protein DIJ69_14350 [Streptomyces globisporus]PPA40839.1 hypothetical protein BF14_014360 [Streptomyces griseus]GGW16188.1 hypothetical protein GCM10010264_67010 [Streptomyces globisporus]
MSRGAEVIVLARWADEVMKPLAEDDPERTWGGRFAPVHPGRDIAAHAEVSGALVIGRVRGCRISQLRRESVSPV